jgi:nifR3 family TIM-barrel protein
MPWRGFYIGRLRLENPLILAPMAGITNAPFRLLARRQGAALVVSEMVSAAGLCQGVVRTRQLLAGGPEERPLAVQLFGARPEWMARAAALAEEAGADLIDLNMGCPVRKVVRHGAGAALLKDFGLTLRIVKAVRQSIRVPLTVKTRLGWGPGGETILDLGPRLGEAGADGLVLHARYAVQGFSGRADWEMIGRLVERFPGPVIGNGDVGRPEQVVEMLERTGCSGVMIGRAALGNPWIFGQALARLEGRTPDPVSLQERRAMALTHAAMLSDHVGTGRAVFMLRSVLMWYTRGLRGSAAFRGRINQVGDYATLMDMVEGYFDRLEAESAEELEAGVG